MLCEGLSPQQEKHRFRSTGSSWSTSKTVGPGVWTEGKDLEHFRGMKMVLLSKAERLRPFTVDLCIPLNAFKPALLGNRKDLWVIHLTVRETCLAFHVLKSSSTGSQ